MKKLDDAVKRFGAPDHGRTAKRLRDFEAGLVDSTERAEMLRDLAKPCCEFMLLNGSCHVHDVVHTLQGTPWPWSEAYETSIARHRSVIQSLHVLLNQKDKEIGALQSLLNQRDEEIGKRHAQARDLWITGGLVALVLLSAYYGLM